MVVEEIVTVIVTMAGEGRSIVDVSAVLKAGSGETSVTFADISPEPVEASRVRVSSITNNMMSFFSLSHFIIVPSAGTVQLP